MLYLGELEVTSEKRWIELPFWSKKSGQLPHLSLIQVQMSLKMIEKCIFINFSHLKSENFGFGALFGYLRYIWNKIYMYHMLEP